MGINCPANGVTVDCRTFDLAVGDTCGTEVILAGACIVRTVLEKAGAESLTVSDRGLRHGLIVERFG